MSRELESMTEWTEFVSLFHLLIKHNCEVYFNVTSSMDQT